MHTPQEKERTSYEQGWQLLSSLDPQAGQRILDGLQDIAPDLATGIIEIVFGRLYTRPALDLKQRQLVTLTALTVLGDSEPQLRFHLRASLNVGLTREEIVEALMNCVPFIGIPRVFNALEIAKQLFTHQDHSQSAE